MFGNPILTRCSACDKPLYMSVPGWKLNAFNFILWMVFIEWIAGPMPEPFPFIVAFTLIIPWVMAERRVYHALWYWKHPQRCQGGHAEPQPTHV